MNEMMIHLSFQSFHIVISENVTFISKTKAESQTMSLDEAIVLLEREKAKR